MLTYLFTVLNQIAVIFLLMVLGYVLYRKGIITDTGSREISALLMQVITPMLIVSSFHRAYDPVLARQLALAGLLSVPAYALPIALSALAFRRDRLRVEKTLCLTFSNNGFMAIPLLQALLGSVGVILGSAHIVLGNIIIWTYAAQLINGESYKLNVRKIVLNPGTLGLLMGLAVFISPVKLPAPVFETVQYLAGLTTPLAMILLGVYLARTNILDCLHDLGMHVLMALKLLVIPFLLLGLFSVMPLDKTLCTAVLIGSTAPSGVVVPQLLDYFHRDNAYCARTVAYTTLWSIVTMPLVLVAANALL